MAGKEGCEAVLEEGFWDWGAGLLLLLLLALLLVVGAGETGFFEEAKGEQDERRLQGDGPPKLHGPLHVRDDEAAERRAHGRAHDDQRRVDCERLAALVQVEDIDDDAVTEDLRHPAKEPAEESGDHKGRVVVWGGHEGGPDSAAHGAEEGPEDAGAYTDELGEGDEEEGSGY